MNYKDKIEKLKSFPNEREFRFFLMDLLKRIGFKDIQLVHKQGEPEFGKDIIASLDHQLDQKEWYAFIVKHGRILGGTDIIENIKNQIKQSFEYTFISVNGHEIKVNKVRIITNELISGGAIKAIQTSPVLKTYSNYEFWCNERLIDLIDDKYSDFWLPGDFLSKEYKKALSNSIKNEFEIKELGVTKLPENKIQKLLNLFIKPRLIEFSPVKDTRLNKKIEHKRISIDQIVDSNDNFIVEGDPGSGKSRFVNKLICIFLDSILMTEKRTFPVKLNLQNLKENNYDIENTLKFEIKELIPDQINLIDFAKFNFIIFIDSVDDLYTDDINLLSNNVAAMLEKNNYRFIITARSLEKLNIKKNGKNTRELYLQNFNQRQIEVFIKKYFEDVSRGKRLLDVLKESNILDKLPTTPLTITLISLLYENTDYEIPATLTDIYNDFINILLGKLEVRSRAQLIDLELKKRIFGYVAYEMLNEKKFEIEKSEFFSKINSFLSPKGIEISNSENLDRLIINSGLLYIDRNNLIGFKHTSFLEYFAAFEIFYVKNTYQKLISNFNDVNWQNSAIFYAGFSKDMPWFIDELIKGAPNENLRDWLLNVGGIGYLSQALYMTDIADRIKLIEKALDNMVISFREMKELTGKLGAYYQMPLHILGALLVFWFNMNFKSITLAKSLERLYEMYIKKYNDFLESENFEIGYKLFLIASTLATEYLSRFEKLNDLIGKECFIKDPLLVVLGDMFLDIQEIDNKFVSTEKRKKIKNEIKRFKKILINLTKEPAYRFGEDYKRVKKQIQAHQDK